MAFPLARGECFFVALSQNTLCHASKVLHHQWLACVHDPAWGVWVTIGKLVGAIVWIACKIGFVLFAMVLQPIFMAFVRRCHTSELSCGLSWLIHLSHLVFGMETQQLRRSYWAQCVTLHTYVTRTHTQVQGRNAVLHQFCISFFCLARNGPSGTKWHTFHDHKRKLTSMQNTWPGVLSALTDHSKTFERGLPIKKYLWVGGTHHYAKEECLYRIAAVPRCCCRFAAFCPPMAGHQQLHLAWTTEKCHQPPLKIIPLTNKLSRQVAYSALSGLRGLHGWES